jgi:hypothetical protein
MLSVVLVGLLLLVGTYLHADESVKSQEDKDGTGGTGGTGTTPKTYTEEEVKKLREEAAGHRVEKQEARQKLAEAEAKLADIEKAKLTELERLHVEKKEAEEKIRLMSEKLKDSQLKASIAVLAGELNVADTETLTLLLQAKGVSYGETGEPKELRKLVEDLLKEKPFLVKTTPGKGGSAGNPHRTGGGGEANYSFQERRGLTDPNLWVRREK